MPKISIIIPVYNVEKYLDECLQSILVQDYKDYEIILVNDGSNDMSGEICDNYANKYSFIYTIHKKNGGLSDARNVGLNSSNGAYILFVDSDDKIFQDSLNKINQIIMEDPNVDVIFLEAVKLFADGTTVPLDDRYQKSKIFKKSHKEVLTHLATLNKFPGSACTKLVKRNLIVNNQLYFEKGLFSEDIDWTIRLLSKAIKYNYCEYSHYYYRQNRLGSITNTIEDKNVISLLNIIKKWSVNPKEKTCNGIQKEINMFMAYEYLVLLPNYSRLEKSSKRKLKQEIKKYSWLLSLSNVKKIKITRVLKSVFGIEITAKFLSIYLKHRFTNN
ncbi:glycosyltransferase [Sporosarcina sp. BP05]|uniref:glycosyltransferase n=1 Tax=Sporosarcina sp. BP05 TaxID=2758726 RepID=UPI0016483FA2|nr:glycosyltransferase [Sporosarcina sp. BP05]